VTITHPFHPLRGQQFKVLSSKTFNHRDILSLQGSNQGTIAIPREWTDKAEPNLYESVETLLLSFSHLLQLTDLITTLNQIDSTGS
jgi:Family of unknown function (DUF5372)